MPYKHTVEIDIEDFSAEFYEEVCEHVFNGAEMHISVLGDGVGCVESDNFASVYVLFDKIFDKNELLERLEYLGSEDRKIFICNLKKLKNTISDRILFLESNARSSTKS